MAALLISGVNDLEAAAAKAATARISEYFPRAVLITSESRLSLLECDVHAEFRNTWIPSREQFLLEADEIDRLDPSLTISSGEVLYSSGSLTAIGYSPCRKCPIASFELSGSVLLDGGSVAADIRVGRAGSRGQLGIRPQSGEVSKNAEVCNHVLRVLGLAGDVKVLVKEGLTGLGLVVESSSSVWSADRPRGKGFATVNVGSLQLLAEIVEEHGATCFNGNTSISYGGWFNNNTFAEWEGWRERLNDSVADWTCRPNEMCLAHSPWDECLDGLTDERPARFPVLVQEDVFQVDVLRGKTGYTLELQSLSGMKTLRKLEKAVGLTCEQWDRPLHLRWDGKGGLNA